MPVRPCDECKGTGLVKQQVMEKIVIPPMTETDQIFRVEKRGNDSPYLEDPGDLLVKLEVQNTSGLS